jgi:membrane associated rhomboid family serine protease
VRIVEAGDLVVAPSPATGSSSPMLSFMALLESPCRGVTATPQGFTPGNSSVPSERARSSGSPTTTMNSDLPPPPPPPTADVVHCRWHPTRPAGRRCTRCGTPACTECLRPASVGSLCRECLAASRPDLATKVRRWQAGQSILITRVLIALNVVVFAWMTLADTSMLAGRTTGLHVDLGLSSVLVNSPGDLSRLLTSGFIHFGLIHLGFNMYLLYQLGLLLEPATGRVRFTAIYLVSLLGGSVGALLLQPVGLHGGASGAVFGLMGFAAIGYWRQGINPMRTPIGSLLLLNLFITFVVPGISVGGHLGGAAFGAMCGVAATDRRLRNRAEWLILAAMALGSVTISAAIGI